MQPLKPEQKKKLTAERPQASPADVEEYEKLLSERFTVPPEEAAAAPLHKAIPSRAQQIEKRIKELHSKIFGTTGTTKEP